MRLQSALITLLLFLSGVAAGAAAQGAGKLPMASTDEIWWKHAVFYEIYPRSFQDSNGDGVGDLNGITSRLDYLQRLGVDALWITPMYPSPQVDFGYDIANYEAVDPQYGTLADMDRLIAAGKTHHIRVVLDMVLNHTSDQHPWFQEAASSRSNPKHNWYVWNDGLPVDAPGVTAYQRRFAHEGRVPPNNWVSGFGGSAWQWAPAVHQFYYHEFYRQQPDLNWRNPAVEQAAFGAMRFWLDRGVAGFRLDAIPALFEDPQLRNNPETGGTNAQGDPNVTALYTDDLPEVHDVLRRMRAMVDRYPGHRVLIGETYTPETGVLKTWYGAHQDELQLPMDTLVGFKDPQVLSATRFRRYISEAETDLDGSDPLFVFDNHDGPRSIDRFGDQVSSPELKARVNKLLGAVLLTTRDAALMYYGEELGMVTTTPTRREDVKDPIGITGWPKEKGRDGERTPMQWSGGAQAGFSTGPHTWLPIPPSARTVNAAAEEQDPASQLRWFEALIALRKSNAAVQDGTLSMLDAQNPDVLAYVRRVPGHADVIVVMSFSSQPKTISLDLQAAGISGKLKTLLTDDPALASLDSPARLTLAPYTVWIASVE